MRTLAIAIPVGLLLAGAAIAQSAPAGPYQATCTNARVVRGPIVTTLYATCAPSKKESSIPLPCVGEIINRNGELVCRPRA